MISGSKNSKNSVTYYLYAAIRKEKTFKIFASAYLEQ